MAKLDFIKDKDILAPEFSTQLDQYKIKGLIQFCEEQIVNFPRLTGPLFNGYNHHNEEL
jgi:hypothetical protein